MATSLNGWTVIRTSVDPRLRLIKIPGTNRKVRFNRTVAPVFAAFLADWHREMPERLNLNEGPLDGWTYRYSRFVNKYSNHASGTAVDARYDVLKADGKPHMTKEEMRILDNILDRYKTKDGHRIFANGEWWRNNDGMHTEISQSWDRGAKRNTTAKDVLEVKKLLNIDNNGIRRGGSDSNLWDGKVPAFENVIKADVEGIANLAIYRVAARLYDLGFYKGRPPVKYEQKYPVKAIEAFKKAKGISGAGYTKEVHKKLFNL